MQNTQNKAEAYIYLYIPVHILPFHHSGKKKATSEPLSLSLSLKWCKPWGRKMPQFVPYFMPSLCTYKWYLFLNLLFHLELSPTGIEQCSLNPLFYLCRFGKIFPLLHPSCQWGWSHTCQSLRQIGSTVLQEHTTCPLRAIFFYVLIEKTLFFFPW